MNDKQIDVFLGDPIGDPGEFRFLNRLRADLVRHGLSARLTANFMAAGRQTRQIDFLVSTDHRLTHVELKCVSPGLPIVGGLNGPWVQLVGDGQRHSLDTNPYRQSKEGTYAISDAMHRLARRGAVPHSAVKFYRHVDTVVCLYPQIPAGSQLAADDHVDVVGYDDLVDRLGRAGPRPPWDAGHWDAFAAELGVVRETAESPSERGRRANLAAVAEYRRRFSRSKRTDLHELVAVAADIEGRRVASPSQQLAAMVGDHGVVAVKAPSGSGKTHLATHVAIELTDTGAMVVWLPCDEFKKGNFSVLLSRAVAPFSTYGAHELMRRAADAGISVAVVVDGLNACPAPWRPELVEQIEAVRLRLPVGVIVTSTADALSPYWDAATTFKLLPPDPAERASLLASYGLTDRPDIGLGFDTALELSIAAECAATLPVGASRADLLDAYIRRRAPSNAARAALRALAAAMDQELRPTLGIADAVKTLERSPTPKVDPVVIDQTLSCALLDVGQGRVRFRHERFGRFLAAEHLVVTAINGTELGLALNAAHHIDLRNDALSLERDEERRHDALLILHDPNLLVAALFGAFGTNTATQIQADICATLAEAAGSVDSAQLDTPTQGEWLTAWHQPNAWTATERALLTVAGWALPRCLFLDNVASLMDHTDRVCARHAQRLRAGGHTAPISATITSTYGTPLRNDDCLAASIVIAAARDRRHHRLVEPGPKTALVPRLLAGQHPPRWGRLMLAATLADPDDPDDLAAIPDLLTTAWRAGGYHLRLETLETTQQTVSTADAATASRIRQILEGIETTNWALNDTLLEVKARFGMVEAINTLETIKAEIAATLRAEHEPDGWVAAYRIVASQFEDEDIFGPYCAAVDNLAAEDRVRLLVMAAKASRVTGHTGFFDDWTLNQIADQPDTEGCAEVLHDAVVTIDTKPMCIQQAVAVHLHGLRGWAQIAETLPPAANALDADSAAATGIDRRAWHLVDELIFACLRGVDDPATAAQIWSQLLTAYAPAAIDVLYQLRSAAAIIRSGTDIHSLLIDAYPDEIRRLLEWGLTRRDQLTSLFPYIDSGHGSYVVCTLGQIGTTSTVALLRSYLMDPTVGHDAAVAIQATEHRVDNPL